MTDFDALARDWDSDPIKVERARAVADEIRTRTRLSRTMTALEYGCGTGLLSFALRPFMGSITLADTAPGMLSVLKDKIEAAGAKNMTPMKLDLSTDPPPSEQYDLIYTLLTLHHVPDTEKLLRQFYLLLKGTGVLCIADLEKEDGSFHGMDSTVHKGFHRYLLKQQVLSIGFGRAEFYSCYTITKKTNAALKTFPLFLMVAEKQ